MTVMSVEKRPETRPVLSLVGCWDENADGAAREEQFDQRPPHLLDLLTFAWKMNHVM